MDIRECSAAVQKVKLGMVLNNYYWAVWAIMMLEEAEETDAEAYQWDFLVGRCQLHQRVVADFGVGQL